MPSSNGKRSGGFRWFPSARGQLFAVRRKLMAALMACSTETDFKYCSWPLHICAKPPAGSGVVPGLRCEDYGRSGTSTRKPRRPGQRADGPRQWFITGIAVATTLVASRPWHCCTGSLGSRSTILTIPTHIVAIPLQSSCFPSFLLPSFPLLGGLSVAAV